MNPPLILPVTVGVIEGVGVSMDGRVWRLRGGEYLLVPWHLDGHGYPRVCFKIPGTRSTASAFPHRLVAQAFLSNPRGLPEINHIDAVKTNNHVSNLEWCSRLENMAHANRLGLLKQPRCSEFGGRPVFHRRVTENTAARIRELSGAGWSYSRLMSEFDLAKSTISYIVNRRTWAWVPDPSPLAPAP
jgi:hypothetical protein